MALQFSTAVRNAMLDAIETATGPGAKLRLYSGAAPANPAAAATGTMLVGMALPADWMASASGGSKALSGTWQAPARLAKRAADERPYLIDLAPLLGWHELALGVEHIEAPGLGVGPARTRLGRYLEVRLAGGEVDHPRPHQDHGLSATVRTTRGAVAVAVDVRVHAR